MAGRRVKDEAGNTYGLWRVCFRVPSSKDGARWYCECACGNDGIVRGQQLRSGRSRSCGCNMLEAQREARATGHSPRDANLPGSNVEHGLCKTPEYRAWQNMLARCYTVTHEHYTSYGGHPTHPVRVCAEWRESFVQFLDDMGPRPDGLTLERKDPFGDYTPDNCVWDTWENQRKNTRRSCKC